MKVDIKLDPEVNDPYAVIYTNELTSALQELVRKLTTSQSRMITATKNQKIFLLNPEDIFYFYSENQKVYARTESDFFVVKARLYELEQQFAKDSFVKISNSIVANVGKIANMEMSLNGTMCVRFKNNTTEYASRRYVAKLKNYLGL